MLPLRAQRDPGWIFSRRWDLTLLIGSAVLVPLPFLFAWGAQHSGWLSAQKAVDIVNILVAALIGGPHLFSTATYTVLDRDFLRRHPRYTAAAALLPVLVVYLGVFHYRALITFFFTWASLHVLHQIIYLTDCYRARTGRAEPAWSRGLDYGLILTGLYPIGLYKLAQEKFRVGGVVLPYPAWLRALHLPEIAGAVFALLLVAWLAKTAWESNAGLLNGPKTLLIVVTTLVSFFLPMGSNLDVLFQGYNTWHSFQYLFLLWWINRLRYERGELRGAAVSWLVGRGGMGPYYLCFLAATGVMVLLTLAVRATTTLSADQSYFVVVLSILLMHYYFDHFLFTKPEFAG